MDHGHHDPMTKDCTCLLDITTPPSKDTHGHSISRHRVPGKTTTIDLRLGYDAPNVATVSDRTDALGTAYL